MLRSYDPRTAEPVGPDLPESADADVDAAVAAAGAAAPAWAALSPTARAAALVAVADALDAHADELVALADAETALGEPRLRGEVARTSGQLRMFAAATRDGGYVDAILSPADPATGRPDVRRMLQPIGPVAVFAASNFPFAFSVVGGDTASALAAGCPVVVKAHEGHPRTSRRTAELVTAALAAAGAPDGTFGIVYGVPAGVRLIQHPGVRAAGFTGSTAGGRALLDLATGRPDPIPFFGELGSVNPVVVLPGAAAEDSTALAAGYAGSLTLGVGQFCTNPGLLFVPDGAPLLGEIATAVAASRGGAMLTERIHAGYLAATGAGEWTAQDLVARGTADGAWAAVPEVRTVPLAAFVADLDRLSVERFGPVGLVVSYSDVAELAAVLRRLPGSLTASVHASAAEADDARAVAAALAPRVGRLIMNGWPTGVAVVWAMQHGGPWPASTDAAHTSVGVTALRRWLVPIAYQGWADALLPPALQEANPLGIARTVEPATS